MNCNRPSDTGRPALAVSFRCSRSGADFVAILRRDETVLRLSATRLGRTAKPTVMASKTFVDAARVRWGNYACPSCRNGQDTVRGHLFYRCGSCRELMCAGGIREPLLTCPWCDRTSNLEHCGPPIERYEGAKG